MSNSFGTVAFVHKNYDAQFKYIIADELNKPLFIYLCEVYESAPENFHEYGSFAFMDTLKKNLDGEELYAFFIPNRNASMQKWFLKEFKTEEQIEKLCKPVTTTKESEEAHSAAPILDRSRPMVPITPQTKNVTTTTIIESGERIEVDPIMRDILDKYRAEHNPSEKRDGYVFGRLVNQLVLESDNPQCISGNEELLDMVNVDDYNDLGIDGICIQVNDKIVRSVEHLKTIIEEDRAINKVEIFLIQSKFKKEFKLAEADSFFSGIRQFFTTEPTRNINEKVRNWLDIKNYLCSDEIYSNSMLSWNGAYHINVRVFFAAYADWYNSSEIMGDFEMLQRDLESRDNGLFKVDKFVALPKDVIIRMSKNNNRFVAEPIAIDSRLPLAETDKFSGMAVKLHALQLLKILVDTSTGLLQKGLFDENVRDYQGETKVNSAIRNTLEKDPESFVLRNNGITILVSAIESNGMSKIKLINPQIVNGCQTCNVIYLAYKDGVDLSKVEVFARIIQTTDQETITNIVSSNNNQNTVYDMIYEISRPYHKKLEEYFRAFRASSPQAAIFYERRSKSLAGMELLTYQKVTFRNLIQAAVSIWFGKPNEYSVNESALIDRYRNRIFCDNHDPIIYYASAAMFASYDRLVLSEKIGKEFRRAKPLVCYVIRTKIHAQTLDLNTNPRTTTEIAKSMLELISDIVKFERQVNIVLEAFQRAREEWLHDKGEEHAGGVYDDSKFLTYLMKASMNKSQAANTPQTEENSVPTYSGIVLNIRIDKNGLFYCHISRGDKTIYAHSAMSRGTGINFSQLEVGQMVIYEIGQNKVIGGEWAVNVRLPE